MKLRREDEKIEKESHVLIYPASLLKINQKKFQSHLNHDFNLFFYILILMNHHTLTLPDTEDEDAKEIVLFYQ
jgi:hypothetical protein